MTIVEFYAKARELHATLEDEYTFVGLRFEDREYVVGDELDWSKANDDREDERDFPEYGSEEYDELPSMGGTSAWDMAASAIYKISPWENREDDARNHFITEHAYIIASNRKSQEDVALDDNEVVIADAVVMAVLF